ncbi:TonB-dependent receptor [Indibacter alkaliphilus LW1]|jgi:TonB-linked SusC/RagA family outer membrane protein|uniref:TonB-dependent receptor n=1 Tax=Indibacter alkaliphilus (strain CCUG 57479 / KCTC 22604 / LW1) TaxID=1189612 RepID=S2E6N2_INDAL|nr:SusC/RagA family TonB-linked outer membrane protein [Indibacter alkaliphilus]EOZ97928.1 TonB-dependent receptor [Indibacter alkaliphilus LW1]
MRNYLQKLKALMLVTVLTLFSIAAANAQGREISGTVLDTSFGDPLPGVTVLVKGTTRGTTTDLDGKYTISVQPGDQVLVFSFVGFTPQEVTIGNQSTINIELDEDIQSLQEAVVIGYGTQDKKEITSAVASVGSEQFNRGNFPNPAQLLQGKVAGLSVTRPGGNPNQQPTIRLRGISSFGASQSPLIVLDGVIGASIDAVDPNDIETFDVLKDASAAAIYGTRGAAGVILITTKKGATKKGISSVTINTFGTAEAPTNLIPVLSPEEFVARGGTNFGAQTDWRDQVLQTAYNGTVNASITGGFENTSYLASVNYRNNDGIVQNTNRETLNTRFNLSHGALNNRLRLNMNLAYTTTDGTNVNAEAVRYATIYNPTAPVFENTEAAQRDFGGYFQRPLFDFYNPVALINQQRFTNEQRAAIYSFRADFDLNDKWTLSSQFSQDRFTDLATQFYSRQDFETGFGRNGQAGQNLFDRTTSIWNGTIRFEDEIADRLNFTFLAGGETQIFEERGMNASTTRFLFDQGPNNLGAGGLRLGPGTGMDSFATRAILNSLFGRANFNYANTYFLSASVRAETYSGFGRENQTGLFPAVSAGADLTQVFDMGIFSQFKARTSFGVVGQLPPSPTLALGIYGNGNRIPLDPTDPNSVFVGINQIANPNPQLRWETTREFTVGVDFGLMQGKITGQVDYYQRTISDLIFNTEVPVGAPNEFLPGNFYTATNIWANIGDLTSGGLEFLASVNDLKLGPVSWTPTVNFTIYQRTRIENIGIGSIQLPEIRQGIPGSPGQNNNPIVWNREGERIGDFYGPRMEGLTDGGEYILSGENPDQFERLGNGLPIGDFGFSNTFIYGNWDLNFLARGSWGHMIYNSFRGFYENADGASNTWNSVVTRNTPTNPLVTSTPTFSDLYLERGDFIRLDNLQLGYNFPTTSASISNLRFYGGVQNLITFTQFTGVDPEVRWTDTEDVLNPNPLAPGIERRNTYFLPRIWTLGLTLTFK